MKMSKMFLINCWFLNKYKDFFLSSLLIQTVRGPSITEEIYQMSILLHSFIPTFQSHWLSSINRRTDEKEFDWIIRGMEVQMNTKNSRYSHERIMDQSSRADLLSDQNLIDPPNKWQLPVVKSHFSICSHIDRFFVTSEKKNSIDWRRFCRIILSINTYTIFLFVLSLPISVLTLFDDDDKS